MNALMSRSGLSPLQLRKAQAVGILERICEQFDPTETQTKLARQHYEAVGAWVAAAELQLFRSATIYAQGSFAIGTTNRPIGSDDIDVDLVTHFPDHAASVLPPATLKKLLGDRLKAHATYAPMLLEMPRCWRIDYANEFHLDITPSIPNRACSMGGELVPDRKLKSWKASNPRGYRDLFARRAALQPRVRLQKALHEARTRADVQPFPDNPTLKGVLRRIVQLAKRHRDVLFQGKDERLRPISVIITTLASRAYEICVDGDYETEFDLLIAVVELMPSLIDVTERASGIHWAIWNETTTGENFAEKWNADPERAAAFFSWHGCFLRQLKRIAEEAGLDTLAKGLKESFGPTQVERAFGTFADDVNRARQAGALAASATAGLLISPASAAATSAVRRNTFFGAP